MQPNTTRNLALKLKYLPFLGVVSCAHSRSFMGAFDFFLFAERWSANADHPQKRASNGGKRWWYNHRKNTKIMVVDAWEKDIHNKHSKYLNPLKTTKNLLKMKRKKKLKPKFWIDFFLEKKLNWKTEHFCLRQSSYQLFTLVLIDRHGSPNKRNVAWKRYPGVVMLKDSITISPAQITQVSAHSPKARWAE